MQPLFLIGGTLGGGGVGRLAINHVHPQKITWNLEMMVSNRNLLFQGSIFRFHVCFGGCIEVFHHLQWLRGPWGVGGSGQMISISLSSLHMDWAVHILEDNVYIYMYVY